MYFHFLISPDGKESFLPTYEPYDKKDLVAVLDIWDNKGNLGVQSVRIINNEKMQLKEGD